MMKLFFYFIIALSALSLQAQTEESNTKLSPEAAYIFKGIKTKLTVAEKNYFAEDLIIQYGDNGDTSLKYVYDDKINVKDNITDLPNADVEIFPADLNNDGTEEIFIRLQSLFFGQWLQNLMLYIKDKNGNYILQDSVQSPRLYARAISNKEYPDLIASEPEGPGFYEVPTKFDVYRWNGTKYYVYKHNQPYLKTDKSIEDDISTAYQETLPDSLLKNNISFELATTNKENIKQETPSKKQNAITEKPVSLSPIAATLFNNVQTTMSDDEKNQFAMLTGITEEELNAKTKSGKPKALVNVYPVDFNNDGTDEIFLCITTKPLVIAMNTYFFFAKDYYGKYKPLPGKIGQGVRILLNGKTGFPDLITGTPGLNREVWSWNGQVYRLAQTIASNVVIPYKTMDIDVASKQYTYDNAANNTFNEFDGEWHSPDYNYSFRIKGKTGIATLSNSSNYHVGDIMLRIQSREGDLYHGQQIYTDGAWHDVVLKKTGDSALWMQGGATWVMNRIK